jgi:hypothetical protein
MCGAYVRSGSARKVRRNFQHKFQDITVSHRKLFVDYQAKIHDFWCLMVQIESLVLFEGKLDEIGAGLRNPLDDLYGRPNFQTYHHELPTNLELKIFMTTVVNELQQYGLANRGTFCSWYLGFVHDGEITLT